MVMEEQWSGACQIALLHQWQLNGLMVNIFTDFWEAALDNYDSKCYYCCIIQGLKIM